MSNSDENLSILPAVENVQELENISEINNENVNLETQPDSQLDDNLDPVDKEFLGKKKYSATEEQAMAKGWRPLDEYKGDPQKFRSAEEFLDRTELYDRLSSQNRELKLLKESVKELATLNRSQHEMLLKEKADYLLQQKRLAIETGNVAESEKFEEAYHNLCKNLPSDKDRDIVKEQIQEPHPAAVEFARRNVGWFNEDSEENTTMKQYAIKKEVYLRGLYPEWSNERRLMEVERAVKDFFPYKFRNVNRERPSSVTVKDIPSSVKSSSNKYTYNQLPPHYKEIVSTMVSAMGKNNKLTLDQYAQQLHDIGQV